MTSPPSDVRPESGPMTAAVERLRHELDRWLEAAVEQGGRALNAIGLRGIRRPFVPAIDVLEGDEEVLVLVDLPGLEAEQIDVSVAGNMLTIRGQRTAFPAESGRAVHSSERPAGEFSRSVPLPVPVNPEAVTATLHEGVLSVKIVKSERAKARHIHVNSAASPPGYPAVGGPA